MALLVFWDPGGRDILNPDGGEGVSVDKLLCWVSRLALAGALALALLAVVEWAAQSVGASLLGHAYAAGRLLEFGAIVMVFAIGLLLREIAAELRKGRA